MNYQTAFAYSLGTKLLATMNAELREATPTPIQPQLPIQIGCECVNYW